MGQKRNPLGFRLGTTQRHHSFWFAQPKNASVGLQEDEKIRNCIKNYVKKNQRISSGFEGRIGIQKRIDLIQVIIHIGFPNWLIEGQTRGIEEFKMNVQKEFHSVNRRLNIAITRVEKPYGQPNILAEYIALQFQNRVSFRKAKSYWISWTNGYKRNSSTNCRTDRRKRNCTCRMDQRGQGSPTNNLR